MNELKIVAVITIKQEYRDELLSAIHKLVDATRKEDGNISYDLHQNVNNPAEYTIIEVWKSEQAIDIHNASTHFNEFKNAIDGKINSLKIDVIKKIY